MARSIAEIYDSIIAEKETFASLNDLVPAPESFVDLVQDLFTSPSKVAIWRLWAFIVASATFTLETLWDAAKAALTAQAAAVFTGTPIWWRDQALLFQFGDDLTFNGNQFVYQVLDPTKQIIKQAAVVEVGIITRIKVVKENGVPLTTGELNAFQAYINEKRFAGTKVFGQSQVADLLKVFYDVTYDPLVLAADGSLITDAAVFPVEDAINNFLLTLPFNGELVLTQMTDAIQAAEGVVDPVISDAQAKFGALPYTPIVNTYLTNAGHIAIDTVNFPLDATITYIANV